MKILDTVAALEAKFKDSILEKTSFRGETTLAVAPHALHDVLSCCRNEHGFDYLIDLSSIDNFGEDPRFELVYELYSMSDRCHLRVRTTVSEDSLEAPTVCDLWPTANWHEREVYDMMGIRFAGHPDLRRILMWDGYPYYPLRKDFPLEGKESDAGETAFTAPAPLAGGPFVTVPSDDHVHKREPRSRSTN